MGDEIAIPVSLPLDSAGFLRRECPTCERQFKWFHHGEGEPDAELVEQYFCPLCGAAAGTDAWWTPDQLDYMQASVGPDLDRIVQDSLNNAFKGIKGITFKPDRNFSLGIETTDPVVEPDDMIIVEPPCHSNEPVKIPDDSASHVWCLICGGQFST